MTRVRPLIWFDVTAVGFFWLGGHSSILGNIDLSRDCLENCDDPLGLVSSYYQLLYDLVSTSGSARRAISKL
jgi:hypothetical protein